MIAASAQKRRQTEMALTAGKLAPGTGDKGLQGDWGCVDGRSWGQVAADDSIGDPVADSSADDECLSRLSTGHDDDEDDDDDEELCQGSDDDDTDAALEATPTAAVVAGYHSRPVCPICCVLCRS